MQRAPEAVPASAAAVPADVAPTPPNILEAIAILDAAYIRLDRTIEAVELAGDKLADAEGAHAVAELKAAEVAASDKASQAAQKAASEAEAKAARSLSRLQRRVAAAEAAQQRAAGAVERAQTELAAAHAHPQLPPAEPKPVTPRFANLPLFVEQFVLPHWIHRRGETSRWCAAWWEHAEAVLRLEAIWEAFEVMRLEPAPSLSTWIRDHFDVHLRALTSQDGVFWRCDAREGTHERIQPWEVREAPAGEFVTDAAAQIQPSPAAATSHLAGLSSPNQIPVPEGVH